jgi:DNA-binding MltR family transcriptional regulator
VTDESEEPKILSVRPLTTADYIKMLSEQSEAGNASVLAGLVEDWLQKLLLHVARPMSNKAAKALFEGAGHLSTFSAKIEIAYAFRMLGDTTYNDLVAIKNIRNRFAHTIKFVSFSSEEITKACERLTGWHKGCDNSALYLARTKACVDDISGRIERQLWVHALQDEPGSRS